MRARVCLDGHQKKSYLILISAFILLNFYTDLYAENYNDTQPIHVESDTFTFNDETKIGIYQGHIKLTQGSRILKANYVASYFNHKGQIIKIVANGNPAQYSAFVFHNHPRIIATGNTIYYYPLEDWLEAVGDAQIIQDQNHFRGPRVNYDFKKKIVGSPPSKKGLTQILLAPVRTMNS
jgi:lipopolysaccharide export system protein LptA